MKVDGSNKSETWQDERNQNQINLSGRVIEEAAEKVKVFGNEWNYLKVLTSYEERQCFYH